MARKSLTMRILKTGLPFLILMVLSFSCVPIKKVAYVQDDKLMAGEQRDNVFFIDEPIDNTIRPGDELYIEVKSADEGRTSFNERSALTVRDPSVISFTVDEDGFIKLPYVNKVKVSDLSLFEAAEKIENELGQYLYLPSVFMRFVNNKITILGEVNRPGVYVFNYKDVNILQAIGYANDISTFGNRQKVLIIREEGEYRSKYELDLTSESILTSKYYRIKSNDIIYVEPLKSKKWGMDEVPYNLLLSLASLTIVIMNFMITYYN